MESFAVTDSCTVSNGFADCCTVTDSFSPDTDSLACSRGLLCLSLIASYTAMVDTSCRRGKRELATSLLATVCWDARPKKLVEPWEVICGSFWPALFLHRMSFDDSLVVLGCALLAVGRSKETLVWLHAVVVPLLLSEGDECVSKEFAEFWVVGAAAALIQQGRTIPARNVRPSREFNPTRGFPGQDILPYLSDLTTQPSHQDAAHMVFFFLLFLGFFSLMVICSTFVCGSILLLLFVLMHFVVLLVEELARRQHRNILLSFACCRHILLMMSPLFCSCSGSFQFLSDFSSFTVVLLPAFVCGLTSLLLRAWTCLSGVPDEAWMWHWRQQVSTCCGATSSTSPWFYFGSLLVVWLFWRFSCDLLLPEFCARTVSGPRWHTTIVPTLPCSWSLRGCRALFLVVVVFFISHGRGFPSTLSGVYVWVWCDQPVFAG